MLSNPVREGAGGFARASGRATAQSRWTGQFADPGLEREFQAVLWPEWSRRIRTVVIVSALFVLGLAFADYATLGPGPAFVACLTARLLIVASAMGVWRIAGGERYTPLLERATVAHTIGFVTLLYVVLAIVGRGMIFESAGAIFLTLGIYMFLPLSIVYLTAAGVFAAAGFLAMSWLFLAHTPVEFGVTAAQLALCNVLGMYTALRSHGLRRREWFNQRELRTRDEFDRMIARLSSRFISLPPAQIDPGIQLALADIGQSVGAGRAYVFEFDLDRQIQSNTYEWCGEGVPPHRHELQDLPIDATSWEASRLMRGESVEVPRVSELPVEASTERIQLERDRVRSLVLVPMMLHGRPFGFVGFEWMRDEESWTSDDVALLRVVAEMMANVLVRRRYDETLQRQSEQLQASNRSLLDSNIGQRSFARTISHELQEPLRNITSFTGMLSRRFAGQLDSEGAEYVGFIRSAAERMRTLIEDMSAFASLDYHSRKPGRCDTHAMVQAVLADLKQELESTAADVQCSGLPSLFGDAHQLELVFEHLIHNALKFRHPYRRPEIRIGAEQHADHWEFHVTDNGIGVSREHAGKIFEPFYRLHQWHQLPGSGLGLAACRHIVERHGGYIRVEPNSPHGSVFRFTLPRSI